MYLVTSEQMRCFDNLAIETHKIPGIVLMDHAGRSVANRIAYFRPKQVVVVCGKGNNGGDGWVAARWLLHVGVSVQVLTIVAPDTLISHARAAFEMADASGVTWQMWQANDGAISTADVIVDAVMGTGCARPLAGVYHDAVQAINATEAVVIAVDVPTGVDASTGEVHGIAVHATETIAMQYEKLGTAVTPGAIHAGSVIVEDVGIKAPSSDGLATYVDPEVLRNRWGERSKISHKGSYGRVGIWVGQMHGAAVLAAAGAARVGAGLVVVGTQQTDPLSASFQPDYVMRQGVQPSAAFSDCQSVVIGPGMGQNAPGVRADLSASDGFAKFRGVIDADGLRLVQAMEGAQYIGDGWVLTPHPKECARLLGWTTEAVQARRVLAANTLAKQCGATVLLKGFRTVIAQPNGIVRINGTGDASLAVGGSGDVLSGVIGSLMAQGLDTLTAASIGAWLHGRAGELAGQVLTPVSTTASDIVAYLSGAVREFLHARD